MVSVNLDRLVLGKDTLAALTSVVTREQKLVTEPRVYGDTDSVPDQTGDSGLDDGGHDAPQQEALA